MLLAHAIALAQARSAIAALADRATTSDAAVEYERALLQLDWTHNDITPGITPLLNDPSDVLLGIAETAIDQLAGFGVDALELELVLSMLDAACHEDGG